MKKWILLLLAGLFIAGCSTQEEDQRQPEIRYDVRFPNAAHNEAQITLSLRNLNPVPIQFTMSRTSPGRYALHEFAKNVYNVAAVNGTGDTLDINRPDLHNWEVSGHGGTIKFQYTLYADHADGTYSGVNREHAHLNMPASFVWPRGLEQQEYTVQFHPPESSNWSVATQLQPTDEDFTFTAPDFYYFMDSPTELSTFDERSWTVAGDTTDYTIRLALHHNGSRQQLDDYTDMAKKVVDEQIAVYGEPPAFDYGTYTFIADYLPYVFGDGMEHRNSTILTSTRSLEEGALRNLYTLSHEFFHAWNVERIRPETLQPFDFTEANVSDALWFAEGFTSYYDDLIIRRTGLIDDKAYAQGLAGTLNYVLNAPGSGYYSPTEMSMQAPFVDAASSVDQQNKTNTFISYYSWGAVLGLGLDLKMRSTFNNVTLDDYMQAVWEKFGKPETPYTLDDLQQTLTEVTDSAEFSKNFFDNHIYKGEHMDLKPLLANAGFVLQKENPEQAVLQFGNAKIDFEGNKAMITENTLNGSPLYQAGIDRGDTLVALDGKPLNSARSLQRILAAHAPGDTLSIQYKSLGQGYDGTVVLKQNPTFQVVPFEAAGKEITPQITAFRKSWLGSKAGTTN